MNDPQCSIIDPQTLIMMYIVDVFAEVKYTGNQLAVFTDAERFSSETMQKIAQEMNYSETTFITSGEMNNGGYDVRIFTPKDEIPFAGHPTLGTAYIIQQELIKKPVEQVILNMQVGQIPVNINYDDNQQPEMLWMRQKNPTFGEILEVEAIASLLSLTVDDVDLRYPIEEVSTGLPFFILPVKNRMALEKARVNKEKFLEFVENKTAKAVLIFCPETYKEENDLIVRVFVDYLGIPEDPATGSANGCLAGYLVKNKYFGKEEINIKIEQGYSIDRPSLLLLKAGKNGEQIDVNVGGKVIMIAKGELI